MPNTAMIFAAGRGTRMGRLTQHVPKPLITVAGRPLIDHSLEISEGACIKTTIVNTHYLGSQIEDHLSARNVVISPEHGDLLETGGGLKQALTLHDTAEIITLNSDAVWTGGNPILRLRSLWDPMRMDALLMLVAPSDAVGHLGQGDFMIQSDSSLVRGPGATYTGCQIIKTEPIAQYPKDAFSLNEVWDQLMKKRRVFGVLHDGKWCDVGHPDGIKQAEQMLKEQNV